MNSFIATGVYAGEKFTDSGLRFMHLNLPKIGKRIKTEFGEGKVIRQNILKETLTVVLDSGEEKEMCFGDLATERLFKKKKGSAPKKSQGKGTG